MYEGKLYSRTGRIKVRQPGNPNGLKKQKATVSQDTYEFKCFSVTGHSKGLKEKADIMSRVGNFMMALL